MLQVVDFNEQLEEHIMNLEQACAIIAIKLEEKFRSDFQKIGVDIVVDFIRTVRGQKAEKDDVFVEHYESFIEIGFEEEYEYFPNTYIPIWKIKKEMFQGIGYLTRDGLKDIEGKVECILTEMLQDRQEDAR